MQAAAMADAPSLADHLRSQIRTTGPISIATYMGLCMTHPREGYYKAATPLGAGGDFVTAPEISQMFGELIGFFLVNLWQQMNEPKSFTLLELGPGRGTLMQDALRVATRAEGFADALHLQLFETHPDLKAEQLSRLAPYNPYWAPEIDAVSEDPLLVVANEFFDALPIRQFVKAEDGWHERLVGLRDDALVFGLSPTPLPESALPEEVHGAAPGEVYEVNLAAADVMARLSRLAARQGGAILAIDYGYPKTRTGETFQAVRRHGYADPLAEPGTADLSAHVDFGALALAARTGGLVTHKVTPQGEFLRRLGIFERADMLEKANPDQADAIRAGLTRLTDGKQMGELFKAFVAASPGLVPPGIIPAA
jgi:NADH dehydrogenase [ubiquinone] 1 alpha subcomplex assembly factor 7